MKANWIAGGLLLVLYLLWLTATAPARLLAPMLPPGVQVGQFSGSVWRGAAQPVYWHGLLLLFFCHDLFTSVVNILINFVE